MIGKNSMYGVVWALMAGSALANDAAREVRYDWLTQGERSGSLVSRVHPDGRVISDFEYNDRGRGPKQHEIIVVDAKGLITSLHIEGRSYLGSPVDERFDLVEGQARWKTTLDQGSRALYKPALYAANAGTPQQLAVLARALLQAEGGALPLLPSGEARIERLRALRLQHDQNTDTVEATLYAISGLGFAPSYVWLDKDLSLFAVNGGWMGLTREGWQRSFPTLRRSQEEAEVNYHQGLAKRLTERLATHWCIDNVRVLDVESGQLVPQMSVRVRDGRISAVVNHSESACEDVQRIDGAGQVLMPGLWDMHVHADLGDGVLHLASGVTGARDMANDHEQIMRLTEQFESGEMIGPRMQRAGFIDKKSPYTAPTGHAVDTLEEALAAVDWYAERGYPQIKIYSSIDPAWVPAIAARVHGHGMRLSGHIPAFMTAEQAVRQGFDEIQHLNMLFLNFIAGTTGDTRGPLRFELVADQAGALDLDSPAMTAFIALLKERDTVVEPTANIFDEMFRHRSGTITPSLAAVVAHLPPNVQREALAGRMAITDENAARYQAAAKAQLGLLKRLHAAGVRIVPGTDDIPGFSLQRELQLYVDAGIPTKDVLRMATLDSAKLAGFGERVGRVAEGQEADLILVDGDPLADIAALRRTTRVFRGNRMYRADALHRAIGVKPMVATAR